MSCFLLSSITTWCAKRPQLNSSRRTSLDRYGCGWRSGSALRQSESDEQHGGCGVEGRTWQVEKGVGSDRLAEDVGEETGTEETSDAAEAVDGSLELALLGGAGLAGEQTLGAGPGERHHVEQRDAAPKEDAGFGETEHGVADGSPNQTDGDGSTLAEFGDDGLNKQCSVDGSTDPDGREGEANGTVGPVVAIVGIDDVDVHQDLLRDVSEKQDGGDGQHIAAPKKRERADWIGALP